MPKNPFFKYIKARTFLPDYCGIPYTPNTKHKMRGIDGNGKAKGFNDTELARIREGLERLVVDLISS